MDGDWLTGRDRSRRRDYEERVGPSIGWAEAHAVKAYFTGERLDAPLPLSLGEKKRLNRDLCEFCRRQIALIATWPAGKRSPEALGAAQSSCFCWASVHPSLHKPN